MSRGWAADFEYVDGPWIAYEGGATFVRVCMECRRFVKADKQIWTSEDGGLKPGPNATCGKCGRVEMDFRGFV